MSLQHPIELAAPVAEISSGAVIQPVQIVVGSNKPHTVTEARKQTANGIQKDPDKTHYHVILSGFVVYSSR